MAISVTTRSGKGSPLSIAEGDNNFTSLARSATELVEGNIQLATQAQVTAMTDTTKAVVPGYLEAAIEAVIASNQSNLLPVAIGYFDTFGGLQQSVGVSGVSKGGTGIYNVSFSTPRSSANYIVTVSAGLPVSDFPLDVAVDNRTASGFTIRTYSCTGGSSRDLKDRDCSFVVHDIGL